MTTPKGKPNNSGLSDFKALPEQRGVGPRVQKSEEPRQQLNNADREAFEQLLHQPRRPGIAGAEAHNETFRRLERIRNLDDTQEKRPLAQNPGEQRGEVEPSQPNPAEQQATERLGKPPPEKEGEVVETLDPEVEEMIRHAAMGDPEKEANLLEAAKKHRSLRDFFKHGPGTLTRSFPAIDLSAVFRRDKRDKEDNPR